MARRKQRQRAAQELLDQYGPDIPEDVLIREYRKGQTPILPRSGLYLTVKNANGERFARLFVDVWRGLPLAARRRLKRYWRGFGATVPMIVLTDWAEVFFRDAFTPMCGYCALNGIQLVYNALYLDLFPDDLTKQTIAHELAHVYCHAMGMASHRNGELSDDLREKDAAGIMPSWGYSEKANWKRKNRYIRAIDQDLGKRALGE